MGDTQHKSKHIKLTSHPGMGAARPIPIHWGAADPAARGPIIATLTNPDHRNVIGTHSGSYAVYRAIAIAANMQYDAIVRAGTEIGERVRIPDDRIPADARVEIDAKMAAGYFTPDGKAPAHDELTKPKGRGLAE